jgi:hypothetical protein
VDRFLLKILGVCSPYILCEEFRHEHQGIEANAWEMIFKSMRAFGDLEELYFVIEKKEGFPIENVCDKWRVLVEKRFDKEKKIWDMIRDMNGRECRRYAVPKMMFLTLRRAERARGNPGNQPPRSLQSSLFAAAFASPTSSMRWIFDRINDGLRKNRLKDRPEFDHEAVDPLALSLQYIPTPPVVPCPCDYSTFVPTNYSLCAFYDYILIYVS